MFWRTGCVGCGPICGGRRGRSEPEASPGGEVGGGARTGVLRRWSLSERRQWRPEPPRPVPARLKGGTAVGAKPKPPAVESEMPLSGTGQCLVPVLPRRAKTLFPGRGPLRCAPWSFPPGLPKVNWAGPRAASASVRAARGALLDCRAAPQPPQRRQPRRFSPNWAAGRDPPVFQSRATYSLSPC